jgi:hypothetical protein
MKIYIAAPMHDRPTAHFHKSMVDFVARLEREITIDVASPLVVTAYHYDAPFQVSNLAEERNMMLHQAIEGGYDKLLFVDDDIMFSPGQALRILRAKGEVVGPVYRKKQADKRHIGYSLATTDAPPRRSGENGELIEMACVGMGLTAIDLGFLRTKLDEGRFGSPPDREIRFQRGTATHSIPVFRQGDELVPAFFEFRTGEDLGGNHRFIGEDETFCRHIIELGGSVWLHSRVCVGHVGQYVYEP